MTVILSAVVLLAAGVVIWFRLPYSPVKAECRRLTAARRKPEHDVHPACHSDGNSSTFSDCDWNLLPLPLQHYYAEAGFDGLPKMSGMKADFSQVQFALSKGKPPVDLDYTLQLFVPVPERIALMKTSLYGIPFEGLDTYLNGKGGMKGMLAKCLVLFNQRGREMDQAILATFLAELLLLPSAACSNYVQWKAVDRQTVEGRITHAGVSASGVFRFDYTDELLTSVVFTTSDRMAAGMDGSKRYIPWSAKMSHFRLQDGLLLPGRLSAVWHEEDGDFCYFDGSLDRIAYF